MLVPGDVCGKINHMILLLLQLGPPPLPTDLNVTVNGSAANITWNPPAKNEQFNIDFYKVEIYASESSSLLYSSHVKDTWVRFCLQPSTAELKKLTVNITTVDICGRSNRTSATTNFTLEGKL